MMTVHSQPTLGDTLLREGLISPAQFEQAREIQADNARSIGRILVDKGIISEELRMSMLQKRFGFELLTLKGMRIDPSLFMLIPFAFAEKHRVVPVSKEGETLVVAMEDPSDGLVLETLRSQLGLRIRACVAKHEEIEAALEQVHEEKETLEKATVETEAKKSRLERLARALSLPLLLLLPPALVGGWCLTDTFGIRDSIRDWTIAGRKSVFDLTLYTGLGYMAWAIIMYEINGLIFGNKEQEEE